MAYGDSRPYELEVAAAQPRGGGAQLAPVDTRTNQLSPLSLIGGNLAAVTDDRRWDQTAQPSSPAILERPANENPSPRRSARADQPESQIREGRQPGESLGRFNRRKEREFAERDRAAATNSPGADAAKKRAENHGVCSIGGGGGGGAGNTNDRGQTQAQERAPGEGRSACFRMTT